MDVVDALIAAKVDKPAGIASSEVPVWNGSAWVRSSATKIGAGSLGTGTPSASTFLQGDGTWAGAALSYTPTLTQSGAVTKTVTIADYVQVGKIVTVWFHLAITGAGTTNNPILIGLPVTANTTHGGSAIEIGAGEILDNGTALYHVLYRFNSTTTIAALRNDTLATSVVGVDPNYAVANTDYIKGYVTYLAA